MLYVVDEERGAATGEARGAGGAVEGLRAEEGDSVGLSLSESGGEGQGGLKIDVSPDGQKVPTPRLTV